MLTGSKWKGLNVRHCHIVFGKAIVFYQLGRIQADDTLKLLTIEEHNSIEGKNNMRLSLYVQSLSPEDFSKFDMPGEAAPEPTQPTFTKDQINDLKSLFLLLAHDPDERQVLVAASKGKFADFLEWARTTLGLNDNSHDQAIIDALGGKAMLAKRAALWIEKVPA